MNELDYITETLEPIVGGTITAVRGQSFTVTNGSAVFKCSLQRDVEGNPGHAGLFGNIPMLKGDKYGSLRGFKGLVIVEACAKEVDGDYGTETWPVLTLEASGDPTPFIVEVACDEEGNAPGWISVHKAKTPTKKEEPTMATTTKKKASSKAKAGKRAEGKKIEPAAGTLADYVAHWNKYGEKKKKKARESEIDVLLETARGDLNDAEFLELEQTIAPERVAKREKSSTRAKKGEGLTRAEWRNSKFALAEEQGIWYPGYADGCINCGGTDRKHYSGGRCTHCYTVERNKRLIKEGKMEDPAKKKAARAKAAAEKAKAKATAKLEREKAKLASKKAKPAAKGPKSPVKIKATKKAKKA